MKPFLQKSTTLFFIGLLIIALPLYAQQANDQSEEPFIEKGTILTGFSLGFINASPTDGNDIFINEYNLLTLQLDGLYFLSDRIGVGPLIGYQYYFFERPNRATVGIEEVRRWQFEFGLKSGWYIPAPEFFGGGSGSQFFVDAGISWLQNRLERVGDFETESDYLFGFQVGTGLLIPMGKQIAIETKLGFQSRRKEFVSGERLPDGEVQFSTVNKWLKEISLGVGLKVSF